MKIKNMGESTETQNHEHQSMTTKWHVRAQRHDMNLEKILE
jgi:hypothetical protein